MRNNIQNPPLLDFQEICFRIEVFDDDGKKGPAGKDEIIRAETAGSSSSAEVSSATQ